MRQFHNFSDGENPVLIKYQNSEFGDDAPDIGMLKLCGIGVAMGNAIDNVKEATDVVIGSNDEDGIAKYLEQRNKAFY